MAIQERNDDLMNFIRGEFQARFEPNFAWKSAVSLCTALPGVRGAWPMSAVKYTNTDRAADVSGNGNHLTGSNAPQFSSENLIPRVNFSGANSLFRADGGAANWADITGTDSYILSANRGLAFYAWVYFDNAIGSQEYIMSKYGAAGNRSYRLVRQATGELRGSVSVDGTAITDVTSTATLAQNTWYFTALQYDPSTKLSVWIGDSSGLDETPLAVGVPASIFDSTASFVLGAQTTATVFMTGKQSLDALCAEYHDDYIVKATFNQLRSMFGV
jgi:hypothetical protein